MIRLLTFSLLTLPALITGFSLVTLILGGPPKQRMWLKLCAGWPLGLAVTSVLYLAWSACFTPGQPGFAWVEAAVCLASALLAWFTTRQPLVAVITPPSRPSSLSTRIAAAGLLVLISLALFNFLGTAWLKPQGRYDAWAIWNVRARMLYTAQQNWQNAFSPAFLHPDYPLMLPLSVAHLWYLAGEESQSAPIVLAGIFSFAAVGLVFFALQPAKGWQQAGLAALLLSSAPALISFGAIQYADVPLAAFILCTAVALLAGFESPAPSARPFALAGLAAASAAWTKNEGIPFLAFTGLLLVIFLLYKRRTLSVWPRLAAFIAGAALPALALLYFKLALAPSNDWMNAEQLALYPQRILDPQRHAIILSAIPRHLLGLAEWPLPILLVLLVYAGLVGWKNTPRNPALSLIAAILLLQFAGYLGIYLITPLSIDTHIKTSFPRLLFQLYPAFLLLFFSSVRSPADIWAAPSQP